MRRECKDRTGHDLLDWLTDIESRSCLSIPFWQRANLPWLLEVCVKADGWRDEVDVGLDIRRKTIFIARNMRLLCLRVVINLVTVNFWYIVRWHAMLTLYLVCSNTSASPTVELNRIRPELFEIERRSGPIP